MDKIVRKYRRQTKSAESYVKMQRISVQQASKQLNMSPLTIRTLMQLEKLPIGYFCRKDGASRGQYIIYEELVIGYRDRVENGSL